MDAIDTFRVFGWLRTSDRLSPDDIARLPDLGIEAVINLAPARDAGAQNGACE